MAVTASSNNALRIRNRPVSATVPNEGDLFVFDGDQYDYFSRNLLAPGGNTAISISGAHSVTDEQFETQQLNFTGTLASDAAITLPDSSIYTRAIINDTTGNKSLIVQQTGAVGHKVIVLPGETIWVRRTAAGIRRVGGNPQRIHLDDFWVYRDGVQDDSAAWQKALDKLAALNATGQAASLYARVGPYRINTALTYQGHTTGQGITIEGECGGTRGPAGVHLLWYGSSGGTLMTLTTVNASVIKGIDFNGRGIAGIVTHIRSDQGDGGEGTSGLLFEVCTFTGAHNGSGGETIVCGDDPLEDWQIDNIHFRDCYIGGNQTGSTGTTTTEKGFVTRHAGNCKDFSFTNCHIREFRYPIDWLYSSGSMRIHGGAISTYYDACIRAKEGILDLEGVTVESAPASKFITRTGFGSNTGVTSVRNCRINVGGSDPNNIGIESEGTTILIGNHFRNNEGGGFCIKTGSPLYTDAPGTSNVISIGNMYKNWAGEYMPLMNYSGALILGTNYTNNNEMAVLSIGDQGGAEGSTLRTLKPFLGGPTESRYLAPYTDGAVTDGARIVQTGKQSSSCEALEYTKLDLVVSATSKLMRVIEDRDTDQGRTVIEYIYIDVTEAFTWNGGSSGTITVSIGNNTGSNDQYILPANVGSIQIGVSAIGNDNNQLGTRLARETSPPRGYRWPANEEMYIRFASTSSNFGNGTTTNLATGKLTVTLKTSFLGKVS